MQHYKSQLAHTIVEYLPLSLLTRSQLTVNIQKRRYIYITFTANRSSQFIPYISGDDDIRVTADCSCGDSPRIHSANRTSGTVSREISLLLFPLPPLFLTLAKGITRVVRVSVRQPTDRNSVSHERTRGRPPDVDRISIDYFRCISGNSVPSPRGFRFTPGDAHEHVNADRCLPALSCDLEIEKAFFAENRGFCWAELQENSLTLLPRREDGTRVGGARFLVFFHVSPPKCSRFLAAFSSFPPPFTRPDKVLPRNRQPER